MNSGNLNGWQQFLLVFVRFAVGWHLFYQGWGKFHDFRWTAAPYLESARGPFAAAFRWLAEDPIWLAMVDQLTIWGLMVLGLLLMLGLLTRTASVSAILLLLSFYAAHPPFPYHGFSLSSVDGTELYVNKILIEILALLVNLLFDTGRISGLDILVRGRLRRIRAREAPEAGTATP